MGSCFSSSNVEAVDLKTSVPISKTKDHHVLPNHIESHTCAMRIVNESSSCLNEHSTINGCRGSRTFTRLDAKTFQSGLMLHQRLALPKLILNKSSNWE